MSFELRNPDFKQTVLDKLKGQHFMHHIGFNLSKIELGRMEGEMELAQLHLQQFGFVHGGVTATLMDICMGFAAYSVLPPAQGVVTANLNIDYFNPGTGNKIKAIGWVEKAGAKLVFCKGEIYTYHNGNETLIASASSVMAVIKKD
jgi:uncharacterized protein (TIGR00369 family)